jgi:hypothetical protein
MNSLPLYLSHYLYLNHLIINIFILIYLFFFICFCIYIFSTLYLVGEVSDIWSNPKNNDSNRLKIICNSISLPKVEAYE